MTKQIKVKTNIFGMSSFSTVFTIKDGIAFVTFSKESIAKQNYEQWRKNFLDISRAGCTIVLKQEDKTEEYLVKECIQMIENDRKSLRRTADIRYVVEDLDGD